MNNNSLLRLIELLYAAPGTSVGWPIFLEALRSATGAWATQLVTHHPEAREGDFVANAGGDPEGLVLYETHWSASDPWAYNAKLSPPAGSVINGEALVSTAELRRTAFYADFGRRYGVVRIVGATLETGPAGTSVMSVTAGEQRAPFSASEASLLEALVPHVRQALSLHRQLLGTQDTVADLTAVLDQSRQAIFLLDGRCHVVFMNRAASSLVARRDGLVLDRSELRAVSGTATTALRRLVREVSVTIIGEGAGAGGGFSIEREYPRRPLAVTVAPLPRRDSLPERCDAAVAYVSIADPDSPGVVAEAVLSQLFGLTPAESRLARLVGEGLALQDAASLLGLRESTVRSRIKSIFEKTGCRRQAELVRVIVSLSR